MVKSSGVDKTPAAAARNFKGVRKRKWGKYVCEVRLPNSRDRIWLGSYDTAEKAARAFDAAQFCLRGNAARFNFPDDPPEIPNAGPSMTPDEIREAAARFAHSEPGSGRVANTGTDSPQVSERGCEITALPLVDDTFLDRTLNFGAENYAAPEFGFGALPEFDEYASDFLMPAAPNGDYWPEKDEEMFFWEVSSSLWNF